MLETRGGEIFTLECWIVATTLQQPRPKFKPSQYHKLRNQSGNHSIAVGLCAIEKKLTEVKNFEATNLKELNFLIMFSSEDSSDTSF